MKGSRKNKLKNDIRAVIFDWGQVLVSFPKDGILNYCSMTLGVSLNRLREVYYLNEIEFQKGLVSEDELWWRVCHKLGTQKPKLNSLWYEAVRHNFKAKRSMFDLILRLRKKGLKIALLSNTEIPTMNYFYDMKWDGYFDVLTFSCVDKTVKPEKRIFDLTLKRLGVKAHETVFIDDKPKFARVAGLYGLHGFCFKNVAQLKKDLLKIGFTL